MNSNIDKIVRGSGLTSQKVAPETLLTVNRLDLGFKILYCITRLYGGEVYGRKAYLSHIDIINGFVEAQDPPKLGSAEFILSFDELIDTELRVDDFTIPVAQSDLSLLDGAHRIAASLVKGAEFISITPVDISPFKFDYRFFYERGLEESYTEEAVLNYSVFAKNVRAFIIWPNLAKSNSLDDIDRLFDETLYIKELILNKEEFVNLVRFAYQHEDWLGSESNKYIGAHNKAGWCGSGKENRVFFGFVQGDDHNLLRRKEEIRQAFGGSKHTVHVTDTFLETAQYAQGFLNRNSLAMILKGGYYPSNHLSELLDAFSAWLDTAGIDKKSVLMVGGHLDFVGAKQANDLDFYSDVFNASVTLPPGIEYDESKLPYLESDYDELIGDPKNYFMYRGFKFISLSLAKQLRLKRNRLSDPEEVLVLERYERPVHVARTVQLILNPRWILNKFRIALYRVRLKFYKLRVNK